MKPLFYAHPFSSYCQKVLIALYENGVDFDYRHLEEGNAGQELEALWPLKRFPILVDNGRTIVETSAIIEHLQLHHPGPVRLIPEDPDAAIEVRMLDRIFDNYVMNAMQPLVSNMLRLEAHRDPYLEAEVHRALDKAYAWLDTHMATRTWAAGHAFTLADCAAAPSLFYADWAYQIPPAHAHLKAYRARLLARPSFARAVDEARRYRHYFPLGAPDRD
ncbi:glutathione S-transferase family protein [Sphingomonas sp. JC676]|uniref:glutathione S-transferase family protein n=1 Tax=Sphingomonas sp. JC676 TaxID=2768065 RepID=UPI00165863DC|nr:glutathione S-transferase family protein [Sphingomonas sp. JC676]MBC9031942.1 glutathione S-transferase family protein [Sphingomonas sp. JC676]